MHSSHFASCRVPFNGMYGVGWKPFFGRVPSGSSEMRRGHDLAAGVWLAATILTRMEGILSFRQSLFGLFSSVVNREQRSLYEAVQPCCSEQQLSCSLA